MDLFLVLERYLHRRVAIVTADRMRLQGILSSVTDGCVRLTNVKSSDAIEATGWFERIQTDDPEQGPGPCWPEVVIQLHYVCAVTCLEDDILDVPFTDEAKTQEIPPAAVEQQPEDFLEIEPLTLLIGGDLIKLVDPKRGGNLLEKLTAVRQNVAASRGLLLPKVRVKDQLTLDTTSFRILLNDIQVASGQVYPDLLLAIPFDPTLKLNGIETIEPVRGTPAFWIEPEQSADCIALGCNVVEPTVVIATFYQATVQQYAAELLTYDGVQRLLNYARREHSTTVDTLVPSVVPLPTLHEILRHLLDEGVSIKNLTQILESLGRHIHSERNDDELLARVRVDLSRTLCDQVQNVNQQLNVIGLDSTLLATLYNAVDTSNPRPLQLLSLLLDVTLPKLQAAHGLETQMVLLVPANLRSDLRKHLRKTLPELTVLCHEEIHADLQLVAVAQLTQADLESQKAPPKPIPPKVIAEPRRRKPK